MHFFDPHFPYDPPVEFKTQYPNDPYAAEVAYTDQHIGRILTCLKKHNLEEKTLVILTSDHGESLGEHGEKTHGIFAYESTLRVPLIIAPVNPAQIQSRARLIDIAPTILDYLKLPCPRNLQGRSLLQLMQQESTQEQDSYFEALSMHWIAGWAPLRGFYSEGYKFISLPLPELYDLTADPEEKHNLCKDMELCRKWSDRFSTFLKPMEPANDSRAPVDTETMQQLAALGYISGGAAAANKKPYTAKDDPKNLISFHDRAYLALDSYNQGDTSKALEMLKKVIQERPDYSEAYFIDSFIHSATGAPQEAVATMKRAIQNGVSGAEVEAKLGLYLTEAGKYEEAIQRLNRACELDPKNPTTLNYLGMTYGTAGKTDEAVDAFRRANKLDSSDGMTLNNWGSLYLRQKNFELAAQKFKEALAVNPHIENAYNGLAVACENLQKWDEAIWVWELALKENRRNYDAMLHLATAYLRQNEKQKALPLFVDFEKNAPVQKYGDAIRKVHSLIKELQDSDTDEH